MAILDELLALPLFSEIEPGRLEPLAAVAEAQGYPPGAGVFGHGDPARHLCFVLHGHVALQIPVPGRGVMTVMTVTAGEVFGWSAFVAPHEETASARAMSQVVVLRLDGERLRAACDADPVLGYRVASHMNEVLALRLHALKLQTLDLYGAPVSRFREIA